MSDDDGDGDGGEGDEAPVAGSLIVAQAIGYGRTIAVDDDRDFVSAMAALSLGDGKRCCSRALARRLDVCQIRGSISG